MEFKNFQPVTTDNPVHLKGKYMLVDPCYIIPEEMWDDYCNETNFGNQTIVFELNGKIAVQFSTNCGDGCFPVDNDNEIIGECGVDSGSLSFLPVNDEVLASKNANLGVIIKLDSIFEENNGDARVGNIIVTTGGPWTTEEKIKDKDDLEHEDDWKSVFFQ